MSWTEQLNIEPCQQCENWLENDDLLSKIVLEAIASPALLRVAAIAIVGEQRSSLIVRQGQKAAEEQRLDYDFGFPRGKLKFSDIRKIAKSRKNAERVIQKCLLTELKEEIAIAKSGVRFLGPGPLTLMRPSYRVACSATNLDNLGYKLPKRRFDKKENAKLPCIATFHFFVSIDEKDWEKRNAPRRRTEGRITGLIDVSRLHGQASLRRRPRRIAVEYAKMLRSGEPMPMLIDFGRG